MPDWQHEEFMTVAEIAAILKVTEQTIRNWIDAGTLPALRLGRRVRVLRSDLDRLTDQGRMTQGREPEPGLPAGGFWEGTASEGEPTPASHTNA